MINDSNHPNGHVTVEHVAAKVARTIAMGLRPDGADTSIYYRAGIVLDVHLFAVLPDGVDPDDWDARYAGLVAMIRSPGGADVGRVLEWLDRELPGVMGMIPTEGRPDLAKGVIAMMVSEAHEPREPKPDRGRRRTRGKHHNST